MSTVSPHFNNADVTFNELYISAGKRLYSSVCSFIKPAAFDLFWEAVNVGSGLGDYGCEVAAALCSKHMSWTGRDMLNP